MKYKDYYGILGLSRQASADDVKKSYRKLARKYHPDVSKEKDAEEKFKEVSEAYETLRDPEKRAAYDQLGAHGTGQEFRPPPEFWQRYAQGAGEQGAVFEDVDLADLLAGLAGARAGKRRADRNAAVKGPDYEAAVRLTFEQAFEGTEISLDLSAPEYDEQGFLHRRPHRLTVRVPRGVTNGQRLRVPGKGGAGLNGGASGDLYLDIEVLPHRLFRASGNDFFVDVPLAPWEAVSGTSVELPTPAGTVVLRVPPGTRAGQQLRLAGRGVNRPNAPPGDLYAIVQIVVPTVVSEREAALWSELSKLSTFNPRAHFAAEVKDES